MSSENQQQVTVSVLDGYLDDCSITRQGNTPQLATLNVALEVETVDPPGSKVAVRMRATMESAATGTATGASSSVVASVRFVFVLDHVMDRLQPEVVMFLSQLAWPYLRSALDSMTGLLRVPSFALPLVPPQAQGTPQQASEAPNGVE